LIWPCHLPLELTNKKADQVNPYFSYGLSRRMDIACLVQTLIQPSLCSDVRRKIPPDVSRDRLSSFAMGNLLNGSTGLLNVGTLVFLRNGKAS
jgi:hypothetical protein